MFRLSRQLPLCQAGDDLTFGSTLLLSSAIIVPISSHMIAVNCSLYLRLAALTANIYHDRLRCGHCLLQALGDSHSGCDIQNPR